MKVILKCEIDNNADIKNIVDQIKQLHAVKSIEIFLPVDLDTVQVKIPEKEPVNKNDNSMIKIPPRYPYNNGWSEYDNIDNMPTL